MDYQHVVQSLVKLEVKTEPAAEKREDEAGAIRCRATKNDLPPSCQEGGRFRRHFIPTVFMCVATGNDPWVLVEKDVIDIIQRAWKKIYSETITITTESSVFHNVSHIPYLSNTNRLLLPLRQRNASMSGVEALGRLPYAFLMLFSSPKSMGKHL
jgi:hypothetical protein